MGTLRLEGSPAPRTALGTAGRKVVGRLAEHGVGGGPSSLACHWPCLRGHQVPASCAFCGLGLFVSLGAALGAVTHKAEVSP